MISVVIPVWNRAGMVGRTLESLAAQTVWPDRVVLVDNDSTDDTARVLRQWAMGRKDVEVVCERVPGAAAARNCGLAAVD